MPRSPRGPGEDRLVVSAENDPADRPAQAEDVGARVAQEIALEEIDPRASDDQVAELALESPLHADVADGVGWLTFNNPARHNALTIAMSRSIIEAASTFDSDPAVRVIVVRGSGEKAFMSGADIGEQGAEPAEFRETAHQMLDTLAALDKPLIAMVHGYCLGGGVSVALQADVRLASESSTFAIPAARLGIAYPYNSIGPLLALVGPAETADLLFTGRRLSAADAYRVGLVQYVFTAERLQAETEAYAAWIAANAPLSVRAAKKTLRVARQSLSADDSDLLRRLLRECEASQDYQEGQAAFRARREPRFTGH